MVTRALHDSGLHLIAASDEELIDAAEDNPEGFWENKAIVACNDDLLEAAGGAWDNPPELPPLAVDDPRVAHLADAATAAISALSERAPWGFKDPRASLTAAYWLDLCPDLRFVICVRHPLEVALSLKRRNQNSYSLGLRLWERYYATVLDLVPRERRIVTHYDTFFVDPDGEIARLCAFAGLAPVPPRVRTDLRHHTIGIGLEDAGVSANVRALYTELCREAGAVVPHEPPSDEGRVRRLVLDGAVAARHAEQRRAAIDRLEEREEQFRARIRELEQQLLRDRGRALQMSQTLAAIEPGPIGKALRKFSRRAQRGVIKVVRRAPANIEHVSSSVIHDARRSVDKLPEPAQRPVRRTRRLIARVRRAPVASAKRVRAKAVPKARAAAKRYVPPRARAPLRRVKRFYGRARKDPMSAAKRVARKLPAPVRKPLRRASRVVARTRPSRRRTTDAGRRRAAIPKGPPFRQWKASYAEMVAAAIPAGDSWLMVAPGSPKKAGHVHGRAAVLFPSVRKGEPLLDDLSHIAHLEALRCQGHRYLVLPEGSRNWFATRHEFRDHVTRSYRAVADREGAGALFDLAERPTARAVSLRSAIDELSGERVDGPAVLDWTGSDIARELPGIATFCSPRDDVLPYVDHSVDVVVADETRDVAEARRVASLGVVVVSSDNSSVRVRMVHANGNGATAPRRVVVWSTEPESGDGTTWRARLEECVTAAGAELRLGSIDALTQLADDGRYDVVVVVEPFVLPLPGAIQQVAALVASEPETAHAAKVLRADGSIEAAGGTVFSDRSVASIARGSADVRAAWHEYSRMVCWAPGMVAVAPALLRSARAPELHDVHAFLREWSASVWAHGGSVTYEPSVAAVRVRGDGGESARALPESAWQRVLDLRPQRPTTLDESAWRHLLAHDDVEACRG